MRAFPVTLHKNIRALNKLRNTYAHKIDIDLPSVLFGAESKPFFTREGEPAFDAKHLRSKVESDPAGKGLEILQQIRELTFGWLLDECRKHGITGL